MRSHLIKSTLGLVCMALFCVLTAANAQGQSLGLSIRVNPTTISPGGTVGVFAMVTNNTSSKVRTTVTFTSLSPCGTETNLGYNKLALNPSQTVQVTVSYPIPPDACLGQYAVSISASSGGGKNSTSSTLISTAYLLVQ